jgi:hypothetical protein
MSAPVRRDQFEISPKGITHKPTGANFIPDPGEPGWGYLDPGKLGMRFQTVMTMSRRKWMR